MSKRITICAGIDTGKRKLDVALEQGIERLEADNDSAGHQAVADWLRRHRVKRVGIEASGGYEQEVVAELRRFSREAADRAVVVPDPAERLAPVVAGAVLLFGLGLLARRGRRPRWIRKAY